MKVYRGVREKFGAVVTVEQDGVSTNLDPRFEIRSHSPTGFEWGYGGSGPAQLALAILVDHLSNIDIAQNLYQAFKFKVISALKSDSWTLSSNDIDKVLKKIEDENRNAEL